MSIGDEINGYINKGSEAYEKQKYDEAIESFEKALAIATEHFPNDPKIQELKEVVNMAKQAKSLPVQEGNAAADEARKWAETWGVKVEDVDTVITYKDDLLRENPSGKTGIAAAYYIRGLIFMSKGEHVKAIEDFSNAMDYEPDSIRLYQEKPGVFQERYKANFNGLTLSDYVGTLALQRRAQEYCDIKDYDKAIADFERVVKFDPSFNNYLASVYTNRGIAYDDKKEYDRAISDFEKALKINPDNSTAREFLDIVKAEKAKQ